MSEYIVSHKWKVYMHISPTNKVYIGITSRPTSQRWRNGKSYISNSYFYHAIEKYGLNNFSHKILYEDLDEIEAKEMEINLISKYNSNNRDYGYNLTSGGDGTVGLICSKETRLKISNAHIGKHYDEERKNKQRIAITGKRHSDETKEKIRIGNLGNKNGKRIKVKCITTNEIFDCIKDGARKYNTFYSGISNVCKGKQLSSGKLNGMPLKWEYYSEVNVYDI